MNNPKRIDTPTIWIGHHRFWSMSCQKAIVAANGRTASQSRNSSSFPLRIVCKAYATFNDFRILEEIPSGINLLWSGTHAISWSFLNCEYNNYVRAERLHVNSQETSIHYRNITMILADRSLPLLRYRRVKLSLVVWHECVWIATAYLRPQNRFQQR